MTERAAHEERYGGSRFRGMGRKKCPNCGAHISHGLPGNPNLRARQPCEEEFAGSLQKAGGLEH